jgi:hypothetical protein
MEEDYRKEGAHGRMGFCSILILGHDNQQGLSGRSASNMQNLSIAQEIFFKETNSRVCEYVRNSRYGTESLTSPLVNGCSK